MPLYLRLFPYFLLVIAPFAQAQTRLLRQWTGTDLNDIERQAYLSPGGAGSLVRIALQTPGAVEPVASRECGAGVVFIAGAGEKVGRFRVISERLRRLPIEQYFFDYEDRGRRTTANGRDLAKALLTYRRGQSDRTCRVTLVAHGVGGLISLAALNELRSASVREIGPIQLVAMDTPWYGYSGPNDENFLDAIGMLLAMPFVPEGYIDLRDRSPFFKNLYRAPLPPHLKLRIYFAQDGEQITDYSESPHSSINELIQRHYTEDMSAPPVRPGVQVDNLWAALTLSDAFADLDRRLTRLANRRELTEENIQLELAHAFPRFAGDYESVLDEHWDFAEYLSYEVARFIEEDASR